MKKFIIKFIAFIIVCVFADYLVGWSLEAMASKAIGGTQFKTNQINSDLHADILILGSSRSNHHYSPKAIEDSLQLSTYVIGQDGNGIVLMYPRYKMVSQRKMPKLVVYDLTPDFDFAQDDMHRYLKHLRPLYGRDKMIDSIVNMVDATERFKLLSKTYPHNSMLISYLRGALMQSEQGFYNGYYPLYNDFVPSGNGLPATFSLPISEEKLKMFTNLVDQCRKDNVPIIFTISPFYHGADSNFVNICREVALANNIPLLDFSNDKRFKGCDSLFKDPTHLNDLGAQQFTCTLLPRLHKYIKK